MPMGGRPYCVNPILKKAKPKTTKRPRKQTEDEGLEAVVEMPAFSEPWHSGLAPTSLQDLAVPDSKQKEIRDWLNAIFDDSEREEAFAEPGQTTSRIAVIKGPAGSGKTTTVRLVAQSLGIQLIEYVSENNSEHVLHPDEGDSTMTLPQNVFEPSHTSKFDAFLHDSCRYSHVAAHQGKQLVVVEEMPHVFIMDSGVFHKLLRRVVRQYPQHTPIAFMWTTCLNSTDTFRLFSASISSELNFRTITFNPVSKMQLKKAVKRLHVAGRIPPEELETIIASSAGDLRTLFNEIEIRFNHTPTVDSKSSESPTGCKRAKKDSSSTQASQRQLFKSNFHFFGKVLYAKRLFTGDATIASDEVAKRRFPFLTSPDVLIAERPCSSTSIILKLHQNYVKRTVRIEEVARCSELLSAAELVSHGDFMADKPHFDEYAADISIRGLMQALPPTLVNADGEKVFRDEGCQLVLQKSLKFYEFDNFCRRMKIAAQDHLLDPSSPVSGHSPADLFEDILPFLSLPVHSQRVGISSLTALIYEISLMSNSNRTASDEEEEEEEDGTSHLMQSNFLTRELSKVRIQNPEERAVDKMDSFSNVKGLGENEDPNDYEIDE